MAQYMDFTTSTNEKAATDCFDYRKLQQIDPESENSLFRLNKFNHHSLKTQANIHEQTGACNSRLFRKWNQIDLTSFNHYPSNKSYWAMNCFACIINEYQHATETDDKSVKTVSRLNTNENIRNKRTEDSAMNNILSVNYSQSPSA